MGAGARARARGRTAFAFPPAATYTLVPAPLAVRCAFAATAALHAARRAASCLLLRVTTFSPPPLSFTSATPAAPAPRATLPLPSWRGENVRFKRLGNASLVLALLYLPLPAAFSLPRVHSPCHHYRLPLTLPITPARARAHCASWFSRVAHCWIRRMPRRASLLARQNAYARARARGFGILPARLGAAARLCAPLRHRRGFRGCCGSAAPTRALPQS